MEETTNNTTTNTEPNYQGILCDLSMEQNNNLKKMQKIMIIQSVVITALLLVIVIFILTFGGRLNSVLNEAEKAISAITSLTEQLNTIIEESEITELLKNANNLILESGESMTKSLNGVDDALKKVNDIDFKSLNKAIKDLQSVVSPLAKLFGAK